MADLDVTGVVDPLLVPTEQDTKTTTSSSGGHIMSPGSKQAIDAEHKANIAVADAQRAVGEAQALQDSVKADQQAQAATLARQQAADQSAEYQDQVDRMQAARSAAAMAEDAFANHTFHDYWSNKGMGKRLAASFGLFLGGLGGGENPAATALYRDMDRDFAKQTADLNRQRDVANMKRGDVNDLGVQIGHENAALAIKFAKANEATAAEMIQRLTEAGIPLDQAKNNVTVQGLLARAEEKRREALQHYDRTYQTATSNKQVTGDSKANLAQQRLDLQKQKLTLRDPETGKELGMMPTAESVVKKGDELGQIRLYRDKVLAVADSIEKHGHIYNPLSQEGKSRASDAADVQSIGRNLKHIQASDAGQKLEHQLIGGTGVGIDRSADPNKLRQLANEAYEQAVRGLRATLTPMPGQSQSGQLTDTTKGEGGSAHKPAGRSLPGGATLVKKRRKSDGAIVELMQLPDGRLVAP